MFIKDKLDNKSVKLHIYTLEINRCLNISCYYFNTSVFFIIMCSVLLPNNYCFTFNFIRLADIVAHCTKFVFNTKKAMRNLHLKVHLEIIHFKIIKSNIILQ